MSDLRSYATSLERDIVPRDLAELERVAQRRARLRVSSTLALSAAAFMAIYVLVAGGPATDRGTLPAVNPTPTPVSSLSPEEIAAFGGDPADSTLSDDGVAATLTAHQACPGDPGVAPGAGECRVVYRVTGPGGTHQTYVLTGPNESLGSVAYLGRGEFIVYCPICGDGKGVYTVSAHLEKPRLLPIDGTPSLPRPGLTLVPCRFDTCTFDRNSRELAPLDLATLPFWIDQVIQTPWVSMEPGVERLETGQVYVPSGILLNSGPGAPPSLIVTPGRTALELRELPTKVPASPGLTGWFVAGSHENWTCPCVVDPKSATIAQIDLPDSDATWSKSNEQGWWGLAGDGRTAWVFRDRTPMKVTVPLRAPDSGMWIADGDPTTIAFIERVRAEGGPSTHYLHASLDRGLTWRSVAVPESAMRPSDAPLDPAWRSWPAAR
ncbi:hypothetical protein N802_12155 [Knoellia sinensis KCTC 19936]|uniref:Uncharacterized protein n=1 Tax=Knoellia sinensis KCTC 19936 TaxID=1385520 RepID=A0A0A0JAA8_9MICO|nr:hypothetical protein [Knoellia sinensis]KGN34380.1 hypothetical protein N802_12155 [Knoellia sinensis KCTC 19936]